MESMSEADLVREARGGVEEAFLALYSLLATSAIARRYSSLPGRLAGSRAAADDVTQECFLTLIRGAAFDAGRGDLRSYLFGIARNLVFRSLRISGREAEEPDDAPAPVDVIADILTAGRTLGVGRRSHRAASRSAARGRRAFHF